MYKKTSCFFLLICLLFLNEKLLAKNDTAWADSVYRTLSLRQKIAQLLIIRAYSDKDSVYNDSLTRIIKDNGVGGVCFFQGGPVRQAALTNHLQQSVSIPLLISIDAEWGLGMRLDSAFSFPRQMALGAIQNDSLIYEMGKQVAKSCRRMGIHINYAPVADVNNNPQNPVISFRSFGENPRMVADKCGLYVKGMQDEGIVAVAKHFPGHGDTGTDSHFSLPVIPHTKERMDSIELFPFRELIRQGVQGVMVAHLYLPCYDPIEKTPSTLSRNIVTTLLREQMKFKGMIITDALDMQGVTKYYKPGEIEVKALLAGNDLLLLPQHVEAAITGIEIAIDSGLLDPSMVEKKCLRVLQLKQRLGLFQRPSIDLNGLTRDLNLPEKEILRQKMSDASVTVIKNSIELIPLRGLDRRKIAVLSIGDTTVTPFREQLNRSMTTDHFPIPKKIQKNLSDSICKWVYPYDILILAIHGINSNPADSFGITREMSLLIDTLVRTNRTLLVFFGTPYSLARVPNLAKAEAIVVAYQDNETTQSTAGGIITGGLPAMGKLPVTAGPFPYGSGIKTEKNRLSFTQPEALGIPTKALDVIDSMAIAGMNARAYPGCQVLFAKNGKVFYEKSFGHPRYEDTVKVSAHHLYDLASVTKVAATTLAIMKLYDEGKVSLDDSLGKYLPELAGSNKASLRIRDIMAHQAGLQDWIPFYKSTLKGYRPNPSIYREKPSDSFPTRVAEGLYIRKGYDDTIFRQITNSPVHPEQGYKYSDLGFYLLYKLTVRVTGQSFESYLSDHFYKPLGLSATVFTPRKGFVPASLIPTEYDTVFRKQLVWGDVHDPGAAMLGGICGHAGLFSNASGMAVILQMILQAGSYGGKQYLNPSTIHEFTRVQFAEKGNRRALGFDKPLLHFLPDGPVCDSASAQSFGHSGFTGTYIWADPENQLLYVFLSNRIYPSAANQQLSKLNIRTRVQQAMYDILQKYQIK